MPRSQLRDFARKRVDLERAVIPGIDPQTAGPGGFVAEPRWMATSHHSFGRAPVTNL
jgi:hypothetical protein